MRRNGLPRSVYEHPREEAGRNPGIKFHGFRNGWRKLYISAPEIFEEVRVPHKNDPSRNAVCFKVSKDKAGFLTPLDSFDNGFLQDHYLLLKGEFLRAIGIRTGLRDRLVRMLGGG